ncbi:MAG: type II toxin-antitoxin system VapC family toxin [Anaerolineae bacterium]|nr:type II toxin-antitoxin system VapC family toxin [Anaerolineae bacterium]
MKAVFLDTVYWIARLDPRDQMRPQVLKAVANLGRFQGVTTEAVLLETANYFSRANRVTRQGVTELIYQVLLHPDFQTIPQTHDWFRAGLALYGARLDKQYSLTDCISMLVMRHYGLTDIFTHDRHFAQEGFHVLI